MQNDSFSIKVFCPAGLNRAYRIVELDNWNGKAVIAKRSFFYDSSNRLELNRPGIYIIYGNDPETNSVRMYVGEADPVLPRIKTHHQDKDFWTDLISFSTSDKALTKAHIKYLEAKLIRLGLDTKRCDLGNIAKPALPTLSESDVAYAENFLQNILDCLTILNIDFFKMPPQINNVQTRFELKGKGAAARGYASPNGFIVTAGSTATKQLSNAFKAISSGASLRQTLVNSKALRDLGDVMEFTVDYEFDSPSAAATVVYGNPMNGRTAWKTTSGKTLKEIQAESSQSQSLSQK